MTSWNEMTPDLPTIVDPDQFLICVGSAADGRPLDIYRVERFAQAPLRLDDSTSACQTTLKLIPVFNGGRTPDGRPYERYTLVLKKEAPQWLIDRYEVQEIQRAVEHKLAASW